VTADCGFVRLGIDDRDWGLTIEIGDLAIWRFGARMTIGNRQLRLVNRQSQSSSSIVNLNRQPSVSIANQQSKKPQSPIASPQSI
jgi:hypothetical protein